MQSLYNDGLSMVHGYNGATLCIAHLQTQSSDLKGISMVSDLFFTKF